MLNKTIIYMPVLYFILIIPIFFSKSIAREIPYLQKRGNATQLIVDGRPFLVLGGELHNSSSSSLEYMNPIWPKLAAMNLNTVLAVVSWDLVEPEEGKFDFSLVDGIIDEARQNQLRLILLWFGSWKNGQSHYVPGWIKKDFQRFPHVRTKSGKSLEILTPLSKTNMEADEKAFRAFMKYLKKIDSEEHTVIMIQIQNEVGVLGETRDYSNMANAVFKKPVPSELMNHLKKHKNALLPEFHRIWETTGFKSSGSWTEVFGSGPATDEIFMAWHYARFINTLAAVGKAEYPLPMFVNAWIIQPQDKRPGDYPSGGPQAHLHDIWRAGAPEIDILAPDIYLPNFTEICAKYSRAGNPLFIPESQAGLKGAANLFYSIGHHKAIGYSPFGIESRVSDPENGPIPVAYKTLSQMAPLILESQSKGTIAGISLDKQNPAQEIKLGNHTLNIELRQTRRSSVIPDLAYGIIIAYGPDEYVIAGHDIQVSFSTLTPREEVVAFEFVEEGIFQNGNWIPKRRLNGDAIMLNYDLGTLAEQYKTGTGIKFSETSPPIQRVKLYSYK